MDNSKSWGRFLRCRQLRPSCCLWRLCRWLRRRSCSFQPELLVQPGVLPVRWSELDGSAPPTRCHSSIAHLLLRPLSTNSSTSLALSSQRLWERFCTRRPASRSPLFSFLSAPCSSCPSVLRNLFPWGRLVAAPKQLVTKLRVRRTQPRRLRARRPRHPHVSDPCFFFPR